ncbi:uridine kinase [Hoyosella rhizosphaerae]|nr:uridine kinase [Hoyosella rhizosphaerae]
MLTAAALVQRRSPTLGPVRVVAIDGPSGAGKTMFAAALQSELLVHYSRVETVACDDFATWDNPVAWWPELRSAVLDPISHGRRAHYRAITWADGTPSPGKQRSFPQPDVLILEGVSSARRRFAHHLTVAVWVEWGDDAARLEAAVTRDGEQTREPLMVWQSFEHGWFPIDGTRQRCDLHTGGRSPGN